MQTLTESLPPARPRSFSGQKVVRWSGRFWFVIATPGIWLFSMYIMGFYGKSAFTGNLAAWAEVLPGGILPQDPIGNGALVTHILFAFIINVGGPFQFIPSLRRRFPKFHRLNGRLFVFSGLAASLAGVYMTWVRGSAGGPILGIGNTTAAILIIWFSNRAVRTAQMKQFPSHRKWALRLFLLCHVTWFFRVGLFLWLALTKGAGIDFETFTGPFVTFWAYGQFLLPLTLAELYFWGLTSHQTRKQYAVAALLCLATLLMAGGILMVTLGDWWPTVFG